MAKDPISDARQLPIIVDAHQDIGFNAAVLGRNLLRSAYETRAKELPPSPLWGTATVGFPEMKEANVRVVFASIWAAACDNPTHLPVEPCYETPEEAYRQGQQQLSYYENLVRKPNLSLVRTKRGLERAVSGEYNLGLVLSMEGADPIISPKDLHDWIVKGLRIIGPAHGKTRYAGGTGKPGPLTKLGRELLSEMEREPVILDTSHMAEASFFEAVDLFHGPIIASHSNCRALIPTDRHLTDEMISAIVKREGVIGVALYNAFLSNGWIESGRVKERVTLTHFVEQVKHICQVAGDSVHVGIGSDFDGGFGCESIPAELDTIADLPKIANALAQAGFSEKEVKGVLGENWLRLLNRTLPS
jgi:membrane dipeptidase